MVHIEQILQNIIEKIYSLKLESVSLDNPPKPELGDYAFACFLLAKELKKGPPQIASEIKTYFDEHKNQYIEIESMEVAGGYLNLRLSNQSFTEAFIESLQSGKIYANFEKKDETIIVDYIGANVGKPLHIGHMCTPNIGQSLINLYKKLGYDVISDSHIGDWGIIFGKLILAFKLWGSEEKLKTNAIDHLLELYIKITEQAEKNPDIEQQTRDTFKLLSEGNPESIKMWETFTRESIRFMNIQLARLNVQPEYNIGESFYEGLGLPKMEDYPNLKWDMKSIVKELIEKGIATKNEDGSVGVIFSEETKLPSCILQKRDGTHGYLASDLSAIKYRIENWNWSLKKIIYSVDMRQKLHFEQAFYIAKAAGWLNKESHLTSPYKGEEQKEFFDSPPLEGGVGGGITELFHAANGFISLKDGAMSTRTGKIIRLEALLDEAETRAKKIILEKRQDIGGAELKTLSRIIGIGAIKYGYLSKSRLTNVVFDWDEFMTFEGNSGPYIQYAYVRSLALLGGRKFDVSSIEQGINFETPEEKELVKTLFDFEKILLQAASENYPHIIAGYAYELTKKFNSLYAKVPLQNEQDEGKRNLRLLLVSVFSTILKECFSILAIEMPERM